jgi:hypothetical protein
MKAATLLHHDKTHTATDRDDGESQTDNETS